MNYCNKCNAENADDAVFCAKCGIRLGNVCPECGKRNEEGNAFCNYCGARIDGKTVCKSCGTAYVGDVCPKCGTAISQAQEESPALETENTSEKREDVHIENLPQQTVSLGGTKKILKTTQTCLIFGTILLLFVFSFFTGITTKLRGPDGTVILKTTSSTFYFLIDCWEEIKMLYPTASLPQAGTYIAYIFTAVTIAFNLAVCLVSLVLSAISLALRAGRKRIALAKFLVAPAVSTFAVVSVFGAIFGSSMQGLSAVTVAEIVIVSILSAAAIVLECILNGKALAPKLKKIIPYALSAVLLVAAIGMPSTPLFYVQGAEQSAAAGTTLLSLGMANARPNINHLVFLDFFSLLLFLIMAFLCLFFVLRNLFADAKHRSAVVTFGVLSFLFATAFFAFTFIIKNEFAVRFGSAPVGTMVLSALVFAAIVTSTAMSKKIDRNKH